MGIPTPAIAISDPVKIKAWSPDWSKIKLTPSLKTKAWRLGPSTPGGPYSPPRDTWMGIAGAAFSKDTTKSYVTCTWTETSPGTGAWHCVGTCSSGTVPTPAPPEDDMPEGLQIIIEC